MSASVLYQGESIRVVLVDGVEMVEVVDRRDAMGTPIFRAVDTSDGLKVVTGWKQIAVAGGKSTEQWRMFRNASRRAIRPLMVEYDEFDEPCTFECVIRDWRRRCRRPAWAYDMEQEQFKAAQRERAARRREAAPSTKCLQVHEQSENAA